MWRAYWLVGSGYAISQMQGEEHMNNTNEAIRMARSTGLIDRLINPEQHYEFTDPKKANAVLMSLCQEAADALAAPVQPVAWGVFEGGNLHDMFFTKEEADNMAHLKGLHAEIRPLTTPPVAPAAPDLQAELDATNRQVEILSDALAESRREVAAIKQALAAQQEHEPENEPHVSLASVQEPVAWGKLTDEMVQAATDEYDEWAVDNKGTTECIRAMLVKALKATPPAQPAVPLTDEQIEHLWETRVSQPCPSYPLEKSDWVQFARAIEQAHGITKGQP
jgi:hypothetical protein